MTPQTLSTAEREARVLRWLSMWLARGCAGLDELFTPDAVYIESWGPEYHGVATIRHWFTEWNTRGRVLKWQPRRFFHAGDETVLFWYFQCQMGEKAPSGFEGMSLVRWASDGRICFLQEFGCEDHRYNPYASGPEPVFRDEKTKWY